MPVLQQGLPVVKPLNLVNIQQNKIENVVKEVPEKKDAPSDRSDE